MMSISSNLMKKKFHITYDIFKVNSKQRKKNLCCFSFDQVDDCEIVKKNVPLYQLGSNLAIV